MVGPTTIVVPTVGRPSLITLLEALACGSSAVDEPVVVVDDRRSGAVDPLPGVDLVPCVVLRSGGRGPAAARNFGWRRAKTPWISFLDDDVVPDDDWYAGLLADLAAAPPWVAGSQGRVSVPLPTNRPPTDWERSTSGLEAATWITADMSYRRAALSAVGGFDERFPRAYREDADLGLRITEAHGAITRGTRGITHPVRPADDWASLRQQAGNADDVLMAKLHGRDWRSRAQAPRGRRRRHVTTAAAGAAAVTAMATRRWKVAATAGAAWAVGTGELAAARITPGPRDWAEMRRMALTSAAIPVAATWHTARGAWIHRDVQPWRGLPELVLFDRDGTLVHDVPYNADPGLVRPVPGARAALDRLRAAGVKVGLVTNQSGVGRGRLTLDQVHAVHARVEQLLGPFDTVQLCPHAPEDGCGCRKPAPGMVKQACAELDVLPSRCVVVGDIGSDIDAAAAAGAVGILVPTEDTLPEEVVRARRLKLDLGAAVDAILSGRW